jgi:mono/diheme cytochrome c family protein
MPRPGLPRRRGAGGPAAQRGRAIQAILFTLLSVAAVAVIVMLYVVLGPKASDFAGGKRVALSEYGQADPTGVPAALRMRGLIERGQYLTRAADCVVCHTAKDGAPFAGGRAFVLPFGTLYSTNITPDPDTGIGRYTDAEFLGAIHQGIGRGNTPLYPAMPFASYTGMSDADALAIKAYLFTLPPLHAPAPRNTLIFPLNQRGLMRIWSMLFASDKRYEPNVDRSPQWNRGAYLVEDLGHCGECHTPRNLFFALDNRRKFAGAVQAGWRAYNITPDRAAGVADWSPEDLASYLSTGHAGRGTAAGPMGEAIAASLSQLTATDIDAMVTYIRSVAPVATADLPPPRTTPAPESFADAGTPHDTHAQALYAGACAGCHGWTGISASLPFATLIGVRAVNDPTATNVAQIIIAGAQPHPGEAAPMPAFGTTYSDLEIAGLANFVTARFGATASQLTAARVATMRAAD